MPEAEKVFEGLLGEILLNLLKFWGVSCDELFDTLTDSINQLFRAERY